MTKKQYSTQDRPFQIVVPSVPGYTLSAGSPLDKNFTTEDIVRITDKSMTVLGLIGYIGQGGDVGSYAYRLLALYPNCKAVHMDFNIIRKPGYADNSDICASEQKGLERAEDFAERASAYAIEHCTKPGTIGFVLLSSPIALLAWNAENFITWFDTTPDLDDILHSITLYWFTQSFPHCIYIYC